MSRYPTPNRPGFWWAKLVHPSRMPEGEDWASRDWEPVEVFDNGEGDEALGVFFPGIEPVQWIPDCIWGPEIPRFSGT